VGEAVPANQASVQGGVATLFEVSPPLPSRLTLDPDTGTIGGMPDAETPAANHVVTASNAGGSTQATVRVRVGPALPDAFASLAPGFSAEVVLEGQTKIAKIALAPDGRVFFIEVDAGQVRVVDPVQGLLATPFATLPVLNGGHQGLIGLVLDPDFTNNGHLYVQATVAGDGMTTVDRSQVLRFTDVNSIGTNQTLVVDDLPVSPPGGINNGGELVFRADGTLLVSIGDIQVPELAQEPGSASLAGRVLRYDLSQLPAVVPQDNPVAGDPTFAKGLRNTFGMAIQPVTGGLFAADNGPASNDHLYYLAPGRNGGWGAAVPVPGAEAALTVRLYATVIVPTAVCWHDGTGMPAGYANNLFLASYDEQALRRFVLSGAAFTDIDEEEVFATFTLSANAHKVLDVEVAMDGSIHVATFTGIYRIFAID